MNDIVRQRLKRLKHWQQFGLASTLSAFEVSRSTLFSWKAQLASATGNSAGLNPRSTRPHKPRQPKTHYAVITEIKRLREAHHNLGKEKCFAMLVPFCQTQQLPLPSVSTIGRIIARAPGKMRHSPVHISPKGKIKTMQRAAVTRKPKRLRLIAGECLALDSIIRQRDGMKRTIITVIDPVTHVAFAYAPPAGNSTATAQLHQAITQVFPQYAQSKVLTDNGSEFKGKFAEHLSIQGTTHWHTYPRTPKMNAHCERFNRSIQESFVDYYEDLLFTDLALFNQKMTDWLIFYNTELPHLSTKPNPKKTTSIANLPIPPVQYHLKLDKKSNMYWTNTHG